MSTQAHAADHGTAKSHAAEQVIITVIGMNACHYHYEVAPEYAKGDHLLAGGHP